MSLPRSTSLSDPEAIRKILAQKPKTGQKRNRSEIIIGVFCKFLPKNPGKIF
jgi:hypothetical protein